MTEHPTIRRAMAAAAGRDGGQTGFLQTLQALYESLEPCLEEQPLYASRGLLERLGEPEKAVIFPIIWTDDRGQTQLARGFHIQYTTALGPCRGRLVFRPGLDLSTAKALALETALEYALAGLPFGGGLSGADIAPGELSGDESRRFCRGFMEGLYPHLGPAVHPSFWVGQVPGRELDFLTGQYERLSALSGGTNGAALAAGPLSRAQAVGYGLCHFAQTALRQCAGIRLEGQSVLISGWGAQAAWAGEMAVRMGAQTVAMGDEAGCLFAPGGLPLALLRAMAREPGLPLLMWAIRTPGVEFRPGPALWDIPADVVFLCGGTLIGSAAARRVTAHHPAGVFEGMVLSCTAMAGRVFARSGLYSPGIASGAGGDVMVFRHQGAMSQWEADRQLRAAMEDIFQRCYDESPGDLAQGARIAAFRPVADAALRKGL